MEHCIFSIEIQRFTMRAALSLLSLVIVLAVVLFLIKPQAKRIAPLPSPGAPAAEGGHIAASAALPNPQAVGAQVQSALDRADAARRASEP